MATTQRHDCRTTGHAIHFDAETEGDCTTHCKLEGSPQDGTRLKITIDNQLPQTNVFARVELSSTTGDTEHRPPNEVCRPIYSGPNTTTIEFLLWHSSNQPGTKDTLDIDIYYSRTWPVCNGPRQNPSKSLHKLNITLNPEFEYV